jgi:uncharacterized Zn finger protein
MKTISTVIEINDDAEWSIGYILEVSKFYLRVKKFNLIS